MLSSNTARGLAIIISILVVAGTGLVFVGGFATPSGPLRGGVAPVSVASASDRGGVGGPGTTMPAPVAGLNGPTVPAKYSSLVAGLEAHGIRPNQIHLPSTERAGELDGQLIPGPEYAAETRVVSPGYSAPPAPAGIAYYGQSGSDVPGSKVVTSIDTSSLAGTMNVTNLSALYFDTDNPDQWGTQLNAVLVNVSVGGSNGAIGNPNDFWAQNAVSYQGLNQTLEVNDNTWDFSGSFPTSGTSVIVANDSSDYNYQGVLYVGLGPFLYAPPPFNFTLYLNTSLVNPFICTAESSVANTPTCSNPQTGTADYVGDQTLFYNYSFSDRRTGVHTNGTYDWLTFHTGASSVFDPSNIRAAGFEADGYVADPVGTTDDWEFDFGIGGYAGAGQNDFNGTGTASLDYVADCTAPTSSVASSCTPPLSPSFQSVPAALDFGGETGETAAGMSVEYGSAPATATTAIFSAGPLNLHPLWGYSSQAGVSPGATPVTNSITVTGSPLALTTTPYVFVFLADISVTTPSVAYSWAPDTSSWYLMPGSYDWVAMLADYTEQSGVLTVGTSPTTLSATLPYDSTAGVYTPLWALNDAQLAGISTAGDGSLTSQYLLFNNPDPAAGGVLNAAFADLNDYYFPTFAGLLLWGTTSYVNVHSEVTFDVGSFGPGYNAYLQQELYQTEHVTISNDSAIYGWPAMFSLLGSTAAQNSIPQADLMIWISSDDLVYGDHFVATVALSGFVAPDLVMFYGGTGNVVWGNTFSDPPGVTEATPGTYAGIAEGEDGDLIFNNNFQVDNPVPRIIYNPYTESGVSTWIDQWNISVAASTATQITVNDFPLSGSIVGPGQSFQGGNEWWSYGSTLNPRTTTPFTNVVSYSDFATIFPPGFGPVEAGISVGGDGAPLPGFNATFTEQNLPLGSDWQVTILGVTVASMSTNLSFAGVPNGDYSYAVGTVIGWTTSNATGMVSVNGTGVSTVITWALQTYPASIASSVPTLDVGQTVTFTATASGTAGGYAYTWSGLPNGCSTSASASINCQPSTPGNYTIRATAVAALVDVGSPATTSSVNLTVYADPVMLSFGADPATVTAGSPTQLIVDAGLGSGHYSYEYSGLPTGCSSVSETPLGCTPRQAGTFSVTVTVTDSNGVSVRSTTELTVSAATGGSSAGGGWTSTDSEIVGGLAAGLVVIGVATLLFLRRTKPPVVK